MMNHTLVRVGGTLWMLGLMLAFTFMLIAAI